MSMWQEAFEEYKAAQSSAPIQSDDSVSQKIPKKTSKQTVHIFAYFTDENGKTLRDLPVEERFTMIEAHQQELEQRCKDLEARCRELEDYLDISEEV